MAGSSIGVAVIGAGMAGRAHAQGYRSASTVFEPDLPEIRLVAIADINEALGGDAARRYGYARAEKSWQALLDAPDVDAVSVVVANPLHREIVEALLAAGKHVLCEKPLAPSVADAEAMVEAAAKTDRMSAVGFTFRRSPAINAIRAQIEQGRLGAPMHFSAHYWCDYGSDPKAPMSWRYKGGPGTGALGDIGSHLVDVGEFLCGPVESVQGAVLTTTVPKRALPAGAVVGHAAAALSDTWEPVENEDLASFAVRFANGASGTISVSRVAVGHPNALAFEVFGTEASASFDMSRAAEFGFADHTSPSVVNGYRQVLVGPEHPYIAGGLAMDFPGVGHGQQDFFTYQSRAFLEQIAGLDRLPACPPLSHGLHNLQLLQAVVSSAEGDGRAVPIT